MVGWRKIHNEELYNLYSSLYIIRVIRWRMRWVGHGRDEKCMLIFSWKSKGKRPLGRSRFKWENDVEMYLGEIGWYSVG
jgi:hypothetical protein